MKIRFFVLGGGGLFLGLISCSNLGGSFSMGGYFRDHVVYTVNASFLGYGKNG